MRRLLLALVVVAVLAPNSALAGRFAVGVKKGASAERVAKRLEARTGHPVSIARFALYARARDANTVAATPGVGWVERIRATRRLSFTPNDPLATRQWYLNRIRAFDAWLQLPSLLDVRVAVLDSGIDTDHPELQREVAAGASFVASSWQNDTNGHGTFVAGQIAAALNNAQGIAGIGFPAQLLVAKVVRSDGTISPDAEAEAIRWAVDRNAQVINMSFGGVRDPEDKSRDTYSPLEAAAVQYAVSKGVLVVAAVGNGDSSPEEPWGYAGYPAALPHVIGVSSVARDGSVPLFSNRDDVYNDLSAPGESIFSTLPKALTATARPGCLLQGYSECGPIEFRRGVGTSFSAPQVSGAAALLFAAAPQLQADQVGTLLTRTAVDAEPDTGCIRCTPGRDPLTGWGVLDVTSAVRAVSGAPEPDRYEANDVPALAPRLWGRKGRRVRATVDFWDDQVDVYRVKLRRGTRLGATLRGPRGANTNLFLWKPGTRRIEGRVSNRRLLAASVSRGSFDRIRLQIRKTGWYYLEIKASSRGSGPYSLTVRKRPRQTQGGPTAPR